MADENKLVATSRDVKGTSSARRLRREGIVPAILIAGEEGSVSIQLNEHDFEMLLHHHVGENVILDLDVDGKGVKKVLLKEVQHHPVSGNILHADFLEISMTEKMVFRVRVELVGEPVGVEKEGGILDHLLREIEVECLPTDHVESLDVDVAALGIGDSILAGALKLSDAMILITSPDVAVASVSAPRVEEEEEAEVTAEGEEGSEPEVIGEDGAEKAEGADAGSGEEAKKKDAGKKEDGKKEAGSK